MQRVSCAQRKALRVKQCCPVLHHRARLFVRGTPDTELGSNAPQSGCDPDRDSTSTGTCSPNLRGPVSSVRLVSEHFNNF